MELSGLPGDVSGEVSLAIVRSISRKRNHGAIGVILAVERLRDAVACCMSLSYFFLGCVATCALSCGPVQIRSGMEFDTVIRVCVTFNHAWTMEHG
ncbi:hypothetical protein V1283_007471 [Bradyrhizobium sp. AZCC 2262]|uniref:hypothetical protein n=1 Tax=Bradyrhizobium sp. AZCC 2262 TaxID=3117022 RepID=UPI002FF12B71